jgi:uncharacterized repeat protein (TIGR01451 family)
MTTDVLGKIAWRLLILTVVCLQARFALARGTPAGTDISNQATVVYSIRGDTYTHRSNVATTRVDELVNVSVVWQDSGAVPVSPGDTGGVLNFRVVNTGNGTEAFTLSGNSSGGGEFSPALAGLSLDTNGNGLYDAGVDVLYVPTENDPVLPADGSLAVFVINTIPGSVSDGNRGNSQLTATSRTGTGAPGSSVAAAGDGGGDAVMGTSGGSAHAAGTYRVSVAAVSILKAARILDPSGESSPVTGAVITYVLTVTVSGSGTAEDVVITDAIPENTTYQGGTLTLNSVSLSDAADQDAGDVGVTAPGTVTVSLGNLSAASPAQTITFKVIIH